MDGYNFMILGFRNQRKLPLQIRLNPLSVNLWSEMNDTLNSVPRPNKFLFSKRPHRLKRRTQQGSISSIYKQCLIFL